VERFLAITALRKQIVENPTTAMSSKDLSVERIKLKDENSLYS
jgi:hypothetical protein